MSDVSFDEEEDTLPARTVQATAPKKGSISGLILKTGIVKTEKQANMVMIAIIVIAFGASLLIWIT